MARRMIATIDPGLLMRIRGEFLEMPGLRLTIQQAQRLWGLDRNTCVCLLDTLIDSGFLVYGADQQYARADGQPMSRPRPLGGRQRQPDRDDGAALLRGFDDDPAVMGFHQALDSREAEARASGLRRHER